MSLESRAGALLVGRDEELERLGAHLGLRSEAPGGMVLLSGDAGIGKTRLLAEVAGQATGAGWTVLVGHCLGEAGSTLPWLPFTEMLGRLQSSSPELAEVLTAAHPQLARLVPGQRRATAAPASALPAGDSDRGGVLGADSAALDRGDLVEAVHAGLERLAVEGPVLVVVEDVHWADESSRDLLTLLFTRGFAGPVSLVASYRSDDLHRRHPLRATLAHWSRLSEVHRLDLGPLDEDAVRMLVRALQAQPMAETDVRAVVERAEGNAFFAEELVAARGLGGPGVGEDLSRLLLVRFDGLGPAAQDVVRVAAAAGRQVSHRLLAAVVALPDAELERGLREAIEHQVVVATDSGGYAFRHALLAETVYDDLLPGERVRTHGRFASALEDDPSLGTWADLARHADAAGLTRLALDASVRAGDDALGMGGPQEAARHYARALALLTDDDPRADSVTLRAAEATTSVGRSLRAIDLLQDRLARRPASADPSGRAELLIALAATARITESTFDTLGAAKEALDLTAVDAPDGLRARALAAHAEALADRGRDEEAASVGEEAIAIAEKRRLRGVADEARLVLARLAERRGDPDASRVALERLIADPATRGTPAELRALHHLGALHHRAGDFPEALRAYERGARQGRAAGLEWAPYALECRLLGGIAAYEHGDWELSRRFLDLHGEAPPQPAEALLVSAALYVAAGRGEREAAGRLAEVRPWWEAEGIVAVASASAGIDLLGDSGRLEEAVALHDDAVEVLTSLWHPRFQASLRMSALLLGQLAGRAATAPTAERRGLLERGEQAARAAAAVWADAHERGVTGPEAEAWEARARAEWGRLRWLAADPRHPEGQPGLGELAGSWWEAVRRFDAYGHAFEAARSRARLAAVLRAGGDPAAPGLRTAARQVAIRLGATPLVTELDALLGRAAGEVDRLGEQLTPREREILELVALGRSNREIGNQLFISAKTASVHVSNIMAKLGAGGRGEAVAVARERGLLG